MKTMINSKEYIYCGIPSFMSSPYVDLKASRKYEVVVVGVPIDFGSSYRLGAKYGPRAIREHSTLDRVSEGTYYDLDNDTWIKSNNLTICDIGDLNIWPTNPEKNTRELINIISKIRQNSFPVILGGDHSITYANFKACAKALSAKSKNIGLLHFDAHLDTEDIYSPSLPKIWHGNPFRKLIEEGVLDGKRMVTIGPRGRISEEAYRYTKDKGITLFTSADVKKQGLESILQNISKVFTKDTDYVFLSIDIDCIDMSQAPGTGTPKYAGLNVSELIQGLIAMKELPIIGIDLVEVNPNFDPSGRTAILAGELLYNFLSFGYNKKLQPRLEDVSKA